MIIVMWWLLPVLQLLSLSSLAWWVIIVDSLLSLQPLLLLLLLWALSSFGLYICALAETGIVKTKPPKAKEGCQRLHQQLQELSWGDYVVNKRATPTIIAIHHVLPQNDPFLWLLGTSKKQQTSLSVSMTMGWPAKWNTPVRAAHNQNFQNWLSSITEWSAESKPVHATLLVVMNLHRMITITIYIHIYIYKIDLEVESSTNKFNPQKMPLNLAVLEVTTMWGPLVRYMLVNKSPNNYSYKYPLVI